VAERLVALRSRNTDVGPKKLVAWLERHEGRLDVAGGEHGR